MRDLVTFTLTVEYACGNREVYDNCFLSVVEWALKVIRTGDPVSCSKCSPWPFERCHFSKVVHYKNNIPHQHLIEGW